MKNKLAKIVALVGIPLSVVFLNGCLFGSKMIREEDTLGRAIQYMAATNKKLNIRQKVAGRLIGDLLNMEGERAWTKEENNRYRNPEKPIEQKNSVEQNDDFTDYNLTKPLTPPTTKMPDLTLFSKWNDLNKDSSLNPRVELEGIAKREYNLKNEDLGITLETGSYFSYQGDVKLRIVNSENELISETSTNIGKYDLITKYTSPGIIPGDSEKGDFLSKLKTAEPGEYVISATLNDGRELSLQIRITE